MRVVLGEPQRETQSEVGAPDGVVDRPERFPLTMANAGALDPDEQFVRSVRLLVAGVATLVSPDGALAGRTAGSSAR